MIGTSDGEQYEDSFARTLATLPPGAPEKPADALNEVGSYPGSPRPLGPPQTHMDPMGPAPGIDPNYQNDMNALREHLFGKKRLDESETRDPSKEPGSEEHLKGTIDPDRIMEDNKQGGDDLGMVIDPGMAKDQRRQFRPEGIKQDINLKEEPNLALSQELLDDHHVIKLAENSTGSLSDVAVNAFHSMMQEHIGHSQDFVRHIGPPIPGGANAARPAGSRTPYLSAQIAARELGMTQSEFIRAYRNYNQISDEEPVEHYFETSKPIKVEGKLKVVRDPRFGSDVDSPSQFLSFKDSEGNNQGYMSLSNRGDSLYVNMIQAHNDANSFGPSVTRDLLRQIKEMYPDAKHIMGYRVSGARKAAGKIGTAVQELK